MNNILKINILKQRFAIATLVLVGLLIALPAVSSAQSESSITSTIKSKCDKVAAHYKGISKPSDYATLSSICHGTGAYKDDTKTKSGAAKRLIDLCGYKHMLAQSGAYTKVGSVLGGDCDKIVNNQKLIDMKANPSSDPGNGDPAISCAANGGKDCDLVSKYVNPFIVFLSIIVGVAVTAGIISGGIIYASAGDDPQKVSKGKRHIANALFALLAYIFLYAFIQWIIPQTN